MEAFDACGKTVTHGTFIGARAHTKKRSALERFIIILSSKCFSSTFERSLFHDHPLDTLALKGLILSDSSATHAYAQPALDKNFKSACTPLMISKARVLWYQRTSTRTNLGPVYTKTMWKRYGKFADSIWYDRLRTKRSAGVYTKTEQGRSNMPSLGPTTRSSFFCRKSTTTKRHQAWTGTLCASNTSFVIRQVTVFPNVSKERASPRY